MTTTTLHIENTVHDFDSWKEVFDKFDQFRADGGVRSYRLVRRADDEHHVIVDLDFDSADEAVAFRAALQKVLQTPQASQQLARHEPPAIFDVIEQRTL